MSFSEPFIRRPIGTMLLAFGLLLLGLVAYRFLAVASLPNIEFPTIRVSASRPGADPATMAATVAAPLERRLGEIAGVSEMTSTSGLGTTSITIQFDLKRRIDGAARDVQAAINAAATDLPADLPQLPILRKVNPAASPVLIVALTSQTMTPSELYDTADTVIAPRIAQIAGVADVNVSGAAQPAVRIQLDPQRIAAMGLSLETVRQAVVNANSVTPLGTLQGAHKAIAVETNGQLRTPQEYRSILIKSPGGEVRLGDIARVEEGPLNTRSSAMFNRSPAVLLIITKQANANVIETVDAIKELLPQLRQWVPAGIEVSVLSDRTGTIRASVADMQLTLGLAIALVMGVVALFLRRATATVAAGITVPLSLAGTCAAMWLAGFSINNLTLMALAVSVGFVVDDAIVMIENTFRKLDEGMTPLEAALAGARQIGFTILSISVSLVAAFIPLIFMGDVVGRLLREFSLTLVFAIVVSTVVSLTVTPMICAHFIKRDTHVRRGWFDRIVEGALGAMQRLYTRSLAVTLEQRLVMGVLMLATVGLTVHLYIKSPKGFIPEDDIGLIFGMTEAPANISFKAMSELQAKALDVVLSDPAVHGVGSSLGTGGWSASLNNGRMFISLKPLAEREGASTQTVINRLRRKLANVPGVSVFMFPARDIRIGGRQSKSQYQLALWDPDIDELYAHVPRVIERLKQVPGLTDVTTDREAGGLQVQVGIDRLAAARLGVAVGDIDAALGNAFAQRQVSSIYGQRNQYKVVLEVAPDVQRDPADLERIHVPGSNGAQVPLTAVTRIERGTAPLVVSHQGQFPSVTITYNLKPDTSLDTASADIAAAIAELRLPDQIHVEPAGEAKAARQQASAQPLLILAALVAVYIVLGVLYESLAHPLTIISTLPSAGLGALLALQVAEMELSITALIGIILLIGIVKKNGIMLVDFALEAQRERGLSPKLAILEAARERFRPILMTTMAALLGAVPLAIAAGPGADIRRPLGITIIGGLLLSQLLTLYTTPTIYLALDRLHRRLWGRSDSLRTPASIAGMGERAC